MPLLGSAGVRAQDILAARVVVRSRGKLISVLVSSAWALCQDMPGNVWRDPIDHFPTYSESAYTVPRNFSNFCIVRDEIDGLACA